MADRKISDLTALTAPASGDYLPIVDISEASAANKNKRITIEELLRGAPDGTAAAPGFAFESDGGNGMYLAGTDTVAISTNGTGRLFVDASGNIGAGSDSPQVRLTVYQSSSGEYMRVGTVDSSGGRSLSFSSFTAGGVTGAGHDLNVRNASGALSFSVGSTERLRITSTGALNFVGAGAAGSTQAVSFNGSAPVNSLVIDSSGRARFGAASNATLTVDRGLGGTGINGQIVLGDVGPGTPSARIDGYRTDGSFAGELHLYTSTSGGTVTRAVTVDSSGRLGLGTSSPGNLVTVQSASSATAPEVKIQNPVNSNSSQSAANGLSGGRLLFGATGAYANAGRIEYRYSSVDASFGRNGSIVVSTLSTNTNSLVDALTIDGSQRVGIGTTTPGFTTHIQGATGSSVQNVLMLAGGNTGTTGAGARLMLANGGASSLRHAYVEGVCTDGSGNAHALVFGTNAETSGPTERVRIDSSGRLLVGTSSARSNLYNSTLSSQAQVEGTTYDTSSILLTCNSTNPTAAFPILNLAKSAGSSIGSNTLVTNGHVLGQIGFLGNDGTEFVSGAEIQAVVDGASGANDLPTRLVFSTTADGASSPTERMRITSTGQLRLAGAGITFNGDTAAANELDDYEEGTFTPTIIGSTTAGTATYTSQTGIYTKIGRQVNWLVYLNWSAGTGAGKLQISGLPFTSANISSHNSWSISLGLVDNIAVAANTQLNGYVSNNSSVVILTNQVTGGGAYSVQDYDAAGHLLISGSYAAA